MPLALEGGEPGLGPQQVPWAQVGRGNTRHVPLDTLVQEGPPVHLSSSYPLLPPSHVPRSPAAGAGLGGQRSQPGSPAGFPEPEWLGGITLCTSPGPLILEGPSPSASPLLPPPPSYAPRSNTAWRGPQRAADPVWEPSRLPGAQLGRRNARHAPP